MSYDLGVTVHAVPQLSRRRLISAAIATGLVARSLPAAAQDSTPVSHAAGDADALQVLQSAASAILALETFTFTMETTNGKSEILPGISLTSVEGAVRRPIDMTATLSVSVLSQTLKVSAISVDGAFFIQNPLSGGAWENMGTAPELATMINPDWVLQLALSQIQDASITGNKDGETVIEGYFDLSDAIADLDQDSRDTLATYLADSPVDVAFWINEDNLITRAELYGPIFASESADVEKRIKLGGFNEPVEITAPDL